MAFLVCGVLLAQFRRILILGLLTAIGPFKVERFITTDGYKYLLPNQEWVAFRASGTEPLIRCYIEARSPAQLKRLRAECQKLLAQ